jgi:hypothetical protein
MSGDVAAFLAARLDEDERIADGLYGATRFMGGEPDFYGQGGPAASAFWGHFTAHRMRREVAAKRAIIEAYEFEKGHGDKATGAICWAFYEAMKHLAAVYGGHPGYDPEWKPVTR